MSSRRFRFSLRVDMRSDWSVGSGSGRQGSLDSVVARDADGLPYLPATTLRGIWRDAAEQLAFGLDGGAMGAWCGLVDHLFGSQPAVDERGEAAEAPIPSRLALSDARFPQDLCDAMRGRPHLLQAATLVKPGVALDERSGRAKTDYLRFEQVARQGAALVAQATLALSGDSDADESLVCFAFAATRLMERIGGNRRRGSGRCDAAVQNVQILETDADGGERVVDGTVLPGGVEAAVERIDAIAPRPPTLALPQPHGIEFKQPETAAFDRVPLDLVLDTPTVVARNVLGNVVTSLDHIPGTMLLAGVARLLRKCGLDEPRISAAIGAGDIRVLPAYPAVAIGGDPPVRGLPVPLVFERSKDGEGGSGAGGRLRNRLTDPGGSAPYKPVRGQYIAYDGTGRPRPAFTFLKPPLETRTHNSVEDARQKPTEAMGGVFTYEAIPAGTRLKSEIWLRAGLLDERQAKRLAPPGLEEHVTVGRARKAGYGAVRLMPRAPERARAAVLTPDRRCTFYLASDMLLPCVPIAGGAASPDAALRTAIRAAAGVDVEIVDGDVRTGRTEGWVARWGLPRSSYIVIQAGSTVMVESAQPFDPTPIAREGLGLRRAEGFGHVMADPAFVKTKLEESVEIEPARAGAGATSAPRTVEAADFVRAIERAALRDAIRLRAECAVATPEKRADKLKWTAEKPNTSQLGALRAAMGRLDTASDLDRARSFVAALRTLGRDSKWSSEDAAASTHPLAVLDDLFARPKTIWSLIDLDLAVRDRENPEVEAAAEARTARIWKDMLLTRSADDARADAALQRYAIGTFLHAAMLWHKRAMEPGRTGREE